MSNATRERNTGSGRAPRRRLRPEQRRAEIIDAATQLIATSGYSGQSLAGFAAACGMTKPGLMHYFPNAEALLTAVLEHRDEVDILATATLLEPTTDVTTTREFLTRLVQRNATQPRIVQLYTVLSAEALAPEHPAHDYFTDRLARSRAGFEKYVFAWHPRPDLCAIQVLAFLDGVQLNWLRDPSIDLVAQWESFADGLFGTV
ncbi:TetR/AcrR family transcriptional regulator [Compostimonas suwonensis]|uniref:AcrR family transcriptional regulator n=1 Tax=Compostimonas suwonensis TaxID=1048394 RepID=A0A2M9BCR4_9MICO|nr:TetR/AcrR family transcriptional regulator [Compostimonas suwonensis]PJJ55694.1 AcrR family transcriptional regulator [Compostimonas suwonensis]